MPSDNILRNYRPCPICGKPKTFYAKLCKECNRANTKPTIYYCVDCGKEISWRRKRCKICSIKFMYKDLPQHGKERRNYMQRVRRQNGYGKDKCPVCGGLKNKRAKSCVKCRTFFSPEGKGYGWKGGRIKDGNGYVLIYNPDHPRASKMGYVREHLLIWEQSNGKQLPKGWIIHHLNGIKDDNRPKNLIGLASKAHYILLEAKAKRIQELEALLNHQRPLGL